MKPHTPGDGPFTLRQLGRHTKTGPGLALAGLWIVLDDVFLVAACPTQEGAEAAMRLLSGNAAKGAF